VPPYFVRQRGVSEAEAGLLLGGTAAAAGWLGVTLGGLWSDRWRRSADGARFYVGMVAAILPLPFLVWMLRSESNTTAYALNVLVSITTSMWIGPGAATVQDLVPARLRGTASAAYLVVITFIGLALGPYHRPLSVALGNDLRQAMLWGLLVNPVAALLSGAHSPQRRTEDHRGFLVFPSVRLCGDLLHYESSNSRARSATISRPRRGQDEIGADDAVGGPITTLHQHVGARRLDELVGRVGAEDGDVVDHLERRQHLGAVALAHQRTLGALGQAAHRAVAVETDDQHVTEPPGGAQVADVAGMQQVEDAVGKAMRSPARRWAASRRPGGEGSTLGVGAGDSGRSPRQDQDGDEEIHP
jgi:hypothetical protein